MFSRHPHPWRVLMSPSATQMLYVHLGAPALEAYSVHDLRAPVACQVCAGPATRVVEHRAWASPHNTDQNRVRAPGSPWVCAACVYFHSRTAPVPGRPPAPGKKLGGNYRNYSHLFEAARGGAAYVNASKAEKPAILAFLRRPKAGLWWAAIADSGQKHVIPWAPVNPPMTRGRVRFEETEVLLPAPAGWAIVDDMRALLTAGATKNEIASGSYEPGAWRRCRGALEAFEEAWARGRHGSWFKLALWLAQRDEEAVAKRQAAERETIKVRKIKAPEGTKDAG